MSAPPAGARGRGRVAALGLIATLMGWGVATGVANATNLSWNNGAGGSASTGSNWAPLGPPTFADWAMFNLPGAFVTTWAAPTDTLTNLTVGAGSPAFSITGHLGTNALNVSGNATLTITNGTLYAGGNGSSGTTAGQTLVDGSGSELDVGSGYFGTTAGTSRLDVADGGRYVCRGWLRFGYGAGESFAGSLHHRVGKGPIYYPVIYRYTRAGAPDECVLGWLGTATLDAYDGGYLNTQGALIVGGRPGGSGTLHCYGGSFPGGVTSNGTTYIGANADANPGGAGNVRLEDTFSYFTGPCWLGDPQDTTGRPVKARLTIGHGATVVFGGGLAMSAARSGQFDVTGGLTQVIGGKVTIQQNAPFALGTAGAAAPTLWLENGDTTHVWPGTGGGPALSVARGSPVTLRAAGAGTVLEVHGGVVMADTLGGYGNVQADSGAVLDVLGSVDHGAGAGQCQVHVVGGSRWSVRDTLRLGGGGGFAGAYVDSGATLSVGGPTLLGPAGTGVIFVGGASATIPGMTLGPQYGLVEVGGTGGRMDVTGHFDLTGLGRVIVTLGGLMTYDGGTRGLSVGAGNPHLYVDTGAVLQSASEIDVRGALTLSSGIGDLDALAEAPRTVRASVVGRGAHATHVQNPAPLDRARVQSPVLRAIDLGAINGLGTLAGPVRLQSPSTTLLVRSDIAGTYGRMVVGDSTRSDGFVSIGHAAVAALDTLVVLDSDGGDLGSVTLESGAVLQLPRPGHVAAGQRLDALGRVEGSLDVRDSAWVSSQGVVTGDVALAGTLDLRTTVPTPPVVEPVVPGTRAASRATVDAAQFATTLTLGSLHAAGTGRLTVQIGSPQDQVAVIGAAQLGGTLDVRTLPGQTPTVGSVFTVLTAGSVAGTFAHVTLNGGASSGALAISYNPTNVRIVVTGPITAVEGDPAGAAPPARLRFAAAGTPRDPALALDLPRPAEVRVVIFDLGGRALATLAGGGLAAGRHRFALAGRVPASGMYFARAEVRDDRGTHVLVGRVVALR